MPVGEEAERARRFAWWLPPVVGAAIIFLAVAAILLTQPDAEGSPVVDGGLAPEGLTAREAYRSAADLAEERWPDADLAIVSGHWTELGSENGNESQWSFHFFSASAQRLILVAVSSDEAWLVRDSLSPYPVPTFSQRDWKVDSDEAIQVWWDEVGRALVEHRPDAELVAQLRVSEDYGGQLVWVIGGLASGRADPLTTVVSGLDGSKVDQE